MADLKLESKILSEINLDHKSLQDGVQHLVDWLTKQPHLPNITDEELLKAFIVGSKSVERAKERLEKYFTMKTKHPAAFSAHSRDPNNIVWNAVERMARLPGLTPEGYQMIIFQMPQTKEEMDAFTLLETCKVFFILTDILFKREPITAGQMIAIDCKGMSMEFLTKCLSSFIATSFDFYQHALPVRMKAMICYNSSSVAEIFCNKILKAFFSEKLAKRIVVYTEGHEVLNQYCPEEMMPQDMGGKAPPLQQLIDGVRKSIETEREWIIKESCRGSNETLRPISDDNTEQVRGTFRKLQID